MWLYGKSGSFLRYESGGANSTFSHRWTGGRADRGGTGGASVILSIDFETIYAVTDSSRNGRAKAAQLTAEKAALIMGRVKGKKNILII